MRSENVPRLLLILMSVICVLCLVEFPALINVVDYRGVIGSSGSWGGLNIIDPELLVIHRPHTHSSGEARGGEVAATYQIPPSDMTLFQWDVNYDHHGFRNDVDLTAADMIVIGDSFVEAPTVPSAQLTTSLLASIRGEVVANLGQSAYGPQQELVVLKRYGLPLRPRIVIWMFYEGNDLEDVFRYRQAIRNPRNYLLGFWKRSFTGTVYHAVRRSIDRRPPGVEVVGIFEGLSSKKLNLYFEYPSRPLSSNNLSALDETARTLATAHNLCAAQGAQQIFVFIPKKFRVFRAFCQFPQESECRNWVLNDLPERLESAIRSISPDIGYLDLTPSLVEGVKRGVLPYYQDDDHWSPEGHKIAAAAINDYLVSTRKH